MHHSTHNDTTRDVRNLGPPRPAETSLNPDEKEKHRLRTGRWQRRSAFTIFAFSAIGSLATAVTAQILHDSINPFATKLGALFGLLLLAAAITVGATLLNAGLAECRERPQRKLLRESVTQGRDNKRVLAEIGGTLIAVNDRLTAMEETIKAVPTYGQGVIDGTTMRNRALGDDDCNRH